VSGAARGTAFVTGGSGLVGRALVARLAVEGHRVVALARTRAAAGLVEEAGGEPLHGELADAGSWAAAAAAADRVFHLAQPRLQPPIRGLQIRSLARAAAEGAAGLRAVLGPRPLVMVSTALAWGDAATGREVALARPALAAERALQGPGLRVVRLPWVYGDGGPIRVLALALRAGRFRIVGAGENAWALVAADDAARALVAAAEAPPGIYAAAEERPPTQVEVVAALCAGVPARRPDHLPPLLADLVLGGPMSRAFAASLAPGPGWRPVAGWSPTRAWRRDLVRLVVGRPAPGAE
jgi:nucleoside-diphosphate-sugar epimerase